VFWTITILGLITTSPLTYQVAKSNSTAAWLSYFILSVVPNAAVFIYLILGLRHIRIFLIKSGREKRVNNCWMYAHAIAFAFFFASNMIAKIGIRVDYINEKTWFGLAYVLSFLSNTVVLYALWKVGTRRY
jgi:hypothetical protein